MGRGYDREELYQVGCIGFIKSIQRFNTTFNVKISTYAVPYIVGEIKRFIRDDGLIKVSRSLKELVTKINEIQRKCLMEKGEELSILELAEELKVPKEEIVMALDSVRPIDSVDKEIYEEETETKINKINMQKDEASELVNRLCLTEIISNLEPRDRKIIVLRYILEKTQTEVANILGITQVQVSRLEKKVLTKMRSKIEV